MIKDYLSASLQSKNTVMFVTTIMFISGIVAYFNNYEIVLSLIFTLIGILLIIFKQIDFKYIIFWLIIFYLGFFNPFFRVNNTDTLYKYAPINAKITGQIISIPNKTNNKIKFFMRVDAINSTPIKAKTYITINNGEYNIGDYIESYAKIKRPFKAGNPSQFDYGKYLRNYNCFTTTYATDAMIIDKELSLYWKFLQNLNKVRNNILQNHSKYLQSPDIEILGGIVFGDDAVAPPDYIKTTFINSGLLHILAASGMNVAFIFGFWFIIIRFFRIPFKINILGGMLMVILYTLMTGLGASVLRAALMLIFIQIGKLLDRDANSVVLLAFVASLLLVYNPAYINDVGFQLSFIVTFGLLTTGKVIFDSIKDIKIPEWLKCGIIIPIIAQLWVIPIQMFYFNTISTYSILANILTVPFLSIISFGGFVSSILATITPIADIVCRIFDFVLKYMLDCVVIISNYFSQLPHSLLETTHPTVLHIFVYYAILLILTLIIKIGINKKLLLTVLGLALFLFITNIPIKNDKLEIITFDVRNADTILIKTPQNKYFIIDRAESSFNKKNSTAKLIILKYLKDRGIKNITGFIITHFDLDHANSAVDIIENLNVRSVYINSEKPINHIIHKFAHSTQIKPTIVVNNNVIYSEDKLKIKTYISNIKQNDSENSIITLLSYKDFDMLFMGDAGIIAFNKVKKDIPQNIEVLKVGHHGVINTVNKNMINYLGSKVAIISTGYNTFVQPSRLTLEILNNISVYRTDIHNSIKIITDGKSYNISIFNRDKKKYLHKETYISK